MSVVLGRKLEEEKCGNVTIISSKISYINIKFFLIASSVRTPQKSLITYVLYELSISLIKFTLQILPKISIRKEGDPLVLVVHTRNRPFFFIYTKVTPSRFYRMINFRE